MPSPLGMYPLDFKMNIADHIKPGDPMNKYGFMEESFRNLSFGLNIKQEIIELHRVRLFAGLSSTVNLISNDQTSMELNIDINQEVSKKQLTNMKIENMKKHYFSFSIFTGIEYKINENWDLSMLSSYHQSLGTKSQLNNTCIHQFGFSAGAIRKF